MKRSHLYFGTLVCLMFMAAIIALFLLEPPPSAREPLLILVGALGAAFGGVINYVFGSSMGSAAKNELLARREPGNA